jgi:ADP-heptose:LPS heptosyltransferase
LITLPMLHQIGERLPYIDEVVEFPGYPGIAEQLYSPERALTFLESIQAEKFDLAIQLQGSGVYSNPLLLLFGARWNAGFIRPGDPPGLLDAAPLWPEDGLEVERILKLPEFLGAPSQDVHTDFPLRPEDVARAEDLLRGFSPPFIGLHPAARELTRRWSMERFLATGRALMQNWGGTLVVIGEQADRDEINEALQSISIPTLNLAGKTSLPVLGAVLTRLNAFITNDTGPAHIAYALGVPTVTIFGGGDIQRYSPPQPGPFRLLAHPVVCRPCSYAECPIGYKCLIQVTVEEVVEAVGEIMR